MDNIEVVGRHELLLRKAQDTIGLPVMELESGKILGKVYDLFLNIDQELKGIAIDSKRWFSSVRYIAWEDVVGFGDDAVTIQSSLVLRLVQEEFEWISYMNGARKLKDRPVMTPNGNQIGCITDVYFDTDLGTKVIGLELTDGFISDLKDGRKWLRLPDQVMIGEDAVIVPTECEQALEEIITLNG